MTQLIELVDGVPSVAGRVGRPRKRPDRVTADRGYDFDKCRRQLRKRGITPEIARREHRTAQGSGASARWSSAPSPGCITSSAYSSRYDRRAEIHEAFLAIGCCLVCYRRLNPSL
jgi:IS5 family transposase